jgi:arsenate reductase (thioredoxin)
LLRKVNVLFLCTGAGRVNPYALELLEKNRLPTAGLRSKNWDEFARAGAPKLDLVFTVCDNAAGETCPVWPGQPISAHWGVPDPAAVVGNDTFRMLAFRDACRMLTQRIRIFISLPFASHDRLALTNQVQAIGRLRPDAVEDAAS